jgi:hypothetical protein
MGSNETDQNKQSIAHFVALETAIANGEELLVKELLGNHAMPDIEKSYLVDLAKLSNKRSITELIENIPLKE